MKAHPRRSFLVNLVICTLLVIVPSLFILVRMSTGSRPPTSDGTGTLAEAHDANLSNELAAQTTEPAPDKTATVPSVPNKPKPDETGVPTPPPTWIAPPMTPVPTNSNPDIWKDCPAFAGRDWYPTPAPGESTACPTPVPTATAEPTLAPDEPFISRVCVAPESPDDPTVAARYTRHSPVVVIGTVRRVAQPRWTTDDGRRPANPFAQDYMDPQFRTIITPVEVAVEQYVKGTGPKASITVWAFGGTIGRDTIDLCGSTQTIFEEGQRVVVFLQQRTFPKSEEPLFDVVARFTVGANNEATTDGYTIALPQLLDEIRKAAAQ